MELLFFFCSGKEGGRLGDPPSNHGPYHDKLAAGYFTFSQDAGTNPLLRACSGRVLQYQESGSCDPKAGVAGIARKPDTVAKRSANVTTARDKVLFISLTSLLLRCSPSVSLASGLM